MNIGRIMLLNLENIVKFIDIGGKVEFFSLKKFGKNDTNFSQLFENNLEKFDV